MYIIRKHNGHAGTVQLCTCTGNEYVRKSIPRINDQVICLSTAQVRRTNQNESLESLTEEPSVTCLNSPVALTPVIMKCFERLIMCQVKDCHLDRLQFAYQPNWSTADAGLLAVLDGKVHSPVSLYWLQHLQNHHTELRSPTGLHLQLTALYDRSADFSSKHITKFADDATSVGFINQYDETAYRELSGKTGVRATVSCLM